MSCTFIGKWTLLCLVPGGALVEKTAPSQGEPAVAQGQCGCEGLWGAGRREGGAGPGEEGAGVPHQDSPWGQRAGRGTQGSGFGAWAPAPEASGDRLSVTTKCVTSTLGAG